MGPIRRLRFSFFSERAGEKRDETPATAEIDEAEPESAPRTRRDAARRLLRSVALHTPKRHAAAYDGPTDAVNRQTMPNHTTPFALRIALALSAAIPLSLIAACGGGGSDLESTSDAEAVAPSHDADSATRHAVRITGTALVPGVAGVAASNTLQVAIAIPGFPHAVDVYRPAGATRAIVFLHGLGGYSGQIAHDLGLNSVMSAPTMSTVNWTWLTQNKVMAIFPQGQIPAGSTLPTWSDYIQKSGADDVGFLKALSSYAKSQFGATDVSLAGHSNGGAMTARIWCEATASYKAFVSLAGPMPSSTYPIPTATCTPKSLASYYAVIGAMDTTLQAFSRGVQSPTAKQISVGLTNSILTAEWSRHRDRAQRTCAETPLLTPTTVASSETRWSACKGQVLYSVVTQADHPIASLEQYMGVKMADLVAGFAH